MKKLHIPFSPPRITDEDRQAVLEVLDGPLAADGPRCRALEDAFVGMMGGGFAVTTSSCMAALHLSALHAGLGPGAEAVVPAMAHVAMVHAVELTGARPVFVDCAPATGNIDGAAVEAVITPHTKALFVAHFCGIPCDMTELSRVADKYGLTVVEDCAQAFGARIDGRHVGLFGDMGCFSFAPDHHITTGEGGMLVSRRQDLAAEIARFRDLNLHRDGAERQASGAYDVDGVGLNYRMGEMPAALGHAQIKRSAEILDRRARNFAALKERLAASDGVVVFEPPSDRLQSAHHCLTAVLHDGLGRHRNEVVEALGAQGIETRLHYPHPAPRLNYYRTKYGYDSALYPNAEAISDRSIGFPVGQHLGPKDIKAIADTFGAIAEGLAGS